MSSKSTRIEAFIEKFRGGRIDPNYLGYIECFNQQLYFEAHEVLEGLWLPQRSGPDGAFYKGLIQLAGAFVHLQKNRFGPAASLLRLAQENLKAYPQVHHSLKLTTVLEMIEQWREKLESKGLPVNILSIGPLPKLALEVEA
jgi:predicted metal-dependent hydrolase